MLNKPDFKLDKLAMHILYKNVVYYLKFSF